MSNSRKWLMETINPTLRISLRIQMTRSSLHWMRLWKLICKYMIKSNVIVVINLLIIKLTPILRIIKISNYLLLLYQNNKVVLNSSSTIRHRHRTPDGDWNESSCNANNLVINGRIRQRVTLKHNYKLDRQFCISWLRMANWSRDVLVHFFCALSTDARQFPYSYSQWVAETTSCGEYKKLWWQILYTVCNFCSYSPCWKKWPTWTSTEVLKV